MSAALEQGGNPLAIHTAEEADSVLYRFGAPTQFRKVGAVSSDGQTHRNIRELRKDSGQPEDALVGINDTA